jgi:hypothetical protein
MDKGKITITGSFGVFFPGHMLVHLYDQQGASLGTIFGADVSPTELVTLQTEISANTQAARVSLHLLDTNGVDRGSLGEVPVSATEKLK